MQCMKSLGGQDPGLVTNQLEQHSYEQYSPNSAWQLFRAALESHYCFYCLYSHLWCSCLESWKFYHSGSPRTRHLCLTLCVLQSIQTTRKPLPSYVAHSCAYILPRGILLVETRSYVYFLVVKGPGKFSFGLWPLSQLTSFLEEKPKGDWIGKSGN